MGDLDPAGGAQVAGDVTPGAPFGSGVSDVDVKIAAKADLDELCGGSGHARTVSLTHTGVKYLGHGVGVSSSDRVARFLTDGTIRVILSSMTAQQTGWVPIPNRRRRCGTCRYLMMHYAVP